MPAHQSSLSDKSLSRPAKATPLAILPFRSLTLNNQPYSARKASKTLGVLTLNADFIRKCATTSPLSHPMADLAGPSPIPPDTSKRTWPQLGTLTMEFISKNCPTLFQGLDLLGPPVVFDLDPNVIPMHAPVHRQPILKLESIKAALDTYETTGQLVRVLDIQHGRSRETPPPPNRETSEYA